MSLQTLGFISVVANLGEISGLGIELSLTTTVNLGELPAVASTLKVYFESSCLAR